MTYNPNSPEGRLSHWSEHLIAQKCIHEYGWYVLHTAEVGAGATMVEGPDGKVVMPDLQLFDLIGSRQSRLVEVKAKSGAYRYQIGQVDCTGIDVPKWQAYQRINAGGVPVDLAFIHMRNPHRFVPEIAPQLLWQSVSVLEQCKGMPNTSPAFGIAGGWVWDVRDFQQLGGLPNPPPDIIAALQAIKANLRVWEVPPKLRRPREMPGQFELGF